MSIVHGEEGYYVDEAVNMFEQYLPEADRDFNLYILYAPQVQPEQILDVCRRFPMMSERQVVIVKEMQAVSADYGEKLSGYVSQPTATTMLLLAGRGGALKSKGLVTTAKAHGAAVIEAKRVDERSVAPLISGYVKSKGLAIEAKGLSMLRDYVGTDLSRLYNEIAKLAIVLPPGATITPEVIERNIGISKDYNNFELIDA
ncbi:MAG: DNA polymerase III subunit delta, partial [Muribaculaceae bacterium]|nr:DNA polymerase III subunit delta [Muribaculaceae bacterium]